MEIGVISVFYFLEGQMSIRSAWQGAKMQYSQLLPGQKGPIKTCATGIAIATTLAIWSGLNADWDMTAAALVLAAPLPFAIRKHWTLDTAARIRMLAYDRN
jgi:hypothetical protein